MPELPEVETVCRGLQELCAKRSISGLSVLWHKSFPGDPAATLAKLAGKTIRTVGRRGKLIIINLEGGLHLAIHLKMTGQLVFADPASGAHFGAGHPNDSLVDSLPDRSTRVIFELGSARLYFNDQRKFGYILLLDSAALEQLPFLQNLGPEPFDPLLDDQTFAKRMRRRKGTSVKAALLDQTVIAGVGNIYADECLWGAQLHPARLVATLNDADFARILAALRQVLQLSIDQGGSSSRNYVNAEGKRGAYLDFAAVFQRQGKPCRTCNDTIIKTRVAGRGTHLCPSCQILV